MFNKWRIIRAEGIKVDYQAEIMAGVHQITDMKAHVKEVEKSNAQLAKENEELRRFTLDGYMIAKSVKELTDEREIMVGGLKEKEAKIAQLMNDARALRQ